LVAVLRRRLLLSRASLYPLGVMMFEMLAGRLPFVATTAGDLIAMHITREPPELMTLAPAVSEAVARLVGPMLAKAPAERPTMRAVEERLALIEQQLQAGTSRTAQEGRRRARLLRLGVACALALGVGAGSWQLAKTRLGLRAAGSAALPAPA